MKELALYGGEKIKYSPFGTGKRFGKEELKQLEEALEQNTLFYWYGNKVKEFTKKFADMYGSGYCVAASSGTAAIHVALATVGVTAGDEVIVAPITDMGSIIGILYQNAIPVFAELEPYTYNISAKSIEEKITNKTKAILVVHLAGNAADMDAIMDVAKRHNIKVVEDCAQSYLSYYKGRLVGTIGDIGCFSLNDFKHISAGDGGMLILNNEDDYKKALRFADKNYDRLSVDPAGMKKVPFLAPNYRMTELQGAVAIAQLDRLEMICTKRNEYGDRITKEITGLPGIFPPQIIEGGKSSYWFYMFRIDESEMKVSRSEFSAALAAEGIPNSEGYIPSCIYEYELLANKNAFPESDIPFSINHTANEVKYCKGMCPVAEEILNTAIRVNISEFFTCEDITDIIKAIKKVSQYYQEKK
jgi:perosamine synthetase